MRLRKAAILRKYGELFKALEEYDRTRELPTDRVRLDITLSRRTVAKLGRLREAAGVSVSRIIEAAVEEMPD